MPSQPRISSSDPLIVLGVDPGLRSTGFGVLRRDGDDISSLTFGTISAEPGLSLSERLQYLFAGLVDLIDRWRPAEVAVEDVFVGANKRVAVAMGEARGAVLLAAAQAGLPVFEYSAAQVKRAVAGYGRGDKAQVQAMVRLQLGLTEDPQPDHAADALAAGLCHILCRRAARIEEAAVR